MTVSIAKLKLENVKRVRIVELAPSEVGLTVIGGDNRQGKTSILDAICYALGGERRRPGNLQRQGSMAPAYIRVELSNGLIVERAGEKAALKVVDPTGQRAGQRLLDGFVEELALDLPKFMAMNGKEKGDMVLKIIGIEQELKRLDLAEKKLYDERTLAGRIADQKEKYAAEMPEYVDAGDVIRTPRELVSESQAIMARNAEKANARRFAVELAEKAKRLAVVVEQKKRRVMELRDMLLRAEDEAAAAVREYKDAEQSAVAAVNRPVGEDESTAEVERRIAELEDENAKVRANLDKRKALEDAGHSRQAYAVLTGEIEALRGERRKLLEGADLPLAGLTIEAGELYFDGQPWDCMSGVEKIRVAVAIVRKLKPECGFVLLDGMEAFDRKELAALNEWLTAEGLQAIATRVSTGDECSIIIEDGMVASESETIQEEPSAPANTPAPGEDW